MRTRVEGPYGEHYVIRLPAYPDDESEDHAYALMTRVRDWDANVRAGWMPIENGHKRMIPAQ